MPDLGSAESFAFALRAFKTLATSNVDKVGRESVVELMEVIVENQPIDESDRADNVVSKGDWQGSVDSIPSGDVNRGDSSGQASIDDIKSAASSWKPSANQTFYAVNKRIQAVLAEFGLFGHDPKSGRTTPAGYSSQAPGGFVGYGELKWRQIVSKNVRKVKK